VPSIPQHPEKPCASSQVVGAGSSTQVPSGRQACPSPHSPHEPKQPSSPHTLPSQLATQLHASAQSSTVDSAQTSSPLRLAAEAVAGAHARLDQRLAAAGLGVCAAAVVARAALEEHADAAAVADVVARALTAGAAAAVGAAGLALAVRDALAAAGGRRVWKSASQNVQTSSQQSPNPKQPSSHQQSPGDSSPQNPSQLATTHAVWSPLQLWPAAHSPQLPPQPSSPQILPSQSGTHSPQPSGAGSG
jgi:hypothetical protein